ncbi:hypothetical protein KPL70_026289 [Citrus sinensis]|nr:hypothetical protein KPL70_026289 [Citrus sinensis]
MASIATGGDDPSYVAGVQSPDQLHPTQQHSHQNNKLQLLTPSNLSNTTLSTPTFQQPPRGTHNDLTRLATKTNSTNPTPPNRNTNINPKLSYASTLNPVTVLNSNATSRPQKSFVYIVTGSAFSPTLVKQVQLHRGEPAVHFSAAEIQEMTEPFKPALVVESPIVPFWVSFPYLPIYFMHCKPALFSITSTVGTHLRVDHATTSVNRSSVARVLVEYDISRPLLPRIWIGEGDSGFWQDVVFERVPVYCNSCKHLGHSANGCYVTSHGLRKHQAQGTDTRDNGKQHTPATNVQPKPLRPIGIDDAPTDVRISVYDARTNEIDLDEQYRPNIIGTNTPASHNTVQGPIDDTNNRHVDSHGYDIPEANMVKKSGRHDLSHSDMDFSSGESDEDEGQFFSDLDDACNFSRSDTVIDRIDGQRVARSSRDFSTVTSRKNRNTRRRVLIDWILLEFVWEWRRPFLLCLERFGYFSLPLFQLSCSTSGREALWDALIKFANTHNNPWMVGEDFNVVQSLSEISSGRTQPQAALDAFNLALLDCGLEDMILISHLKRNTSDNSPLLLSYDRNTARGASRFKFLNAWLKHPNCLDIIRQSLSAFVLGCGKRAFQQNLIRLKLCLKAWNKDVFDNVFQWVKEAEEERLRLDFNMLYYARTEQSSARWLSESSAIVDSAVTFFQGLLTDEDSQFQPEDFSFIPSLITEEDDVDLCRIPDIEEELVHDINRRTQGGNVVLKLDIVKPRQFPFTYLGCAVYVGGVRIRHFDDMIRKIRGRISGWANRQLSFGELSIQVWFNFAILPLLYGEYYALFVVLLSLIFVGWLDLVIVVSDFRRRENFSFMASTFSSPPVTLSSTLSLPRSCTSHTTNKIENLVEYSYIPESAQISESSYPLISPYQLYKRPSSFTRSIRTLISTRCPQPKEYIQSSRLDQCALQATSAEQYVTLEIPSELLSNWKREGYTHLHLGGIRLILTLHGRKGLPVTARLVMLDTRFKQYQDAVIGTVLTTLHAGSVLLTFYPNFNLSLQDPNLPTTLKVQVQIQDDQTSDSNLAVSDSHTETDTESSVSTSDSEKSYADITRILMAQPDQPPQGQTSHTEPYVDIPSEVEEEMPESSATNQPPPAQTQIGSTSQKSSNGPWFTFDDLPSHKWRDCLNEMSAWIDLQMLRPGATTQLVLREFATRFTGALRDWFDSLGRYRQLQFVDLPEVSSALAVLHDQFLGDPSAVFEDARRDYPNMKCCSLNDKNLDFHYKRMSLLFYKLNGFNEPTLKHLAKTCLDKLCEQKQFFKELLKDKELFRSACKKPYLQIKCKKKKDCDCSPKKKRHFKKFRNPEFSSRPRRSRKPYRFFRKKSSSSRDFKRQKSSRCFICKRKGHYAKDCPNKREKSIRLVEHLQATTDYSPEKDELEFYFSEQDEPNDETVFALQNSSDDSDSDQSQVIFHQQLLSLDTIVPIPSIKLQILPSKFQRPIPAIGLIDTGAQCNMLNPHILPPDHWIESGEHFKAVNGKLFTTSLITKKPIGIQIFPNCVIWTKVIGSTLPNKDILLGFDILHQLKHLQIIPTGIRVKSMFKPFTNILKLYNLSETPPSYQDISTKLLSFYLESHIEFTHPTPLWKNKSFFIKLPFKLNEDINPTKATHPGMSPSDLLLAQQKCSQLLAQGLIEPTNSQWACQAFYVEKHSEIVRGKKRLVIEYQPLNMFMQDDKFSLPRRQRSHDEHRQLLTQFYDIVQSHGIMLSAKRSTIATDNIEFLGMVIKDGHYQPGKHIAQELLHFPDQQLSKKQVQQFLGIINYIRDFIPHVDHYTHHLSALLKKKPLEWNADHTNAVTTLKQIAQNPPLLKLITKGKRILQTDASDDSWGAILLEELNGKEYFIAHASDNFLTHRSISIACSKKF